MHRIQLSRGPYSDLFGPFCGAQWTSKDDPESIDECGHLVYFGMEEDPEEADLELKASDICFELFEPAPASRSHYFVVRE